MIESLRISQVAVGAVLLLMVTACGGDDAADPERFCEINTEIEELDEFFGAPPEEARATVREARNLLDEAVNVAPDEIRTSVDVAADSFDQILDLFEAADFDEAQIDQAEIDAAFSDEAAAAGASDDIDEWVDANCST